MQRTNHRPQLLYLEARLSTVSIDHCCVKFWQLAPLALPARCPVQLIKTEALRCVYHRFGQCWSLSLSLPKDNNKFCWGVCFEEVLVFARHKEALLIVQKKSNHIKMQRTKVSKLEARLSTVRVDDVCKVLAAGSAGRHWLCQHGAPAQLIKPPLPTKAQLLLPRFGPLQNCHATLPKYLLHSEHEDSNFNSPEESWPLRLIWQGWSCE
ncbi:unnamed protein product [Polarella glacialis]|uniref:Uncharacterized protein n=1 Tax=Polarella glacialis TaxID=89957 RepID=A0A813K5T6_POLGL|nr:unnamed protein product [Polarella glacialis]